MKIQNCASGTQGHKYPVWTVEAQLALKDIEVYCEVAHLQVVESVNTEVSLLVLHKLKLKANPNFDIVIFILKKRK